MRHFHGLRMRTLLLCLTLAVVGCSQACAEPPIAPVKVVTDKYHGVSVDDPYRYMEDFKNPEVQTWVKAQAEFADKQLRGLNNREKLLKRITELDAAAPYALSDYVRTPSGNWYYLKQLPNDRVAKLYRRLAKSGKESLLVDPEGISNNKDTHHTISFFRVSPDETLLLYGYAASGSEQTTLRVFDIASQKHRDDTIDRLYALYAPPCWLPDNKSFVYSRLRKLPPDAPSADGQKFTQAFLHKLGHDPDRDPVVFAHGVKGSPVMEAMEFPAVVITAGSKWAIGQIKLGDENDLTLYVAPTDLLGTSELYWTRICDRADMVSDFAVHRDDIFLRTALDAPRFKVIRTSLEHPDPKTAAVVVPPTEQVIQTLHASDDALYVESLAGSVLGILRVPFAKGAIPQTLELPADEPSGAVVVSHPEVEGVVIQTRSWSRAGRLYDFDPKTLKLSDTQLLPRGEFDDSEWLTSTEVLVSSHDGKRVPLSIVHRRDIKRDGSNPTILAGYGAYGALSPMGFDPILLAWLERGGIFAIAHVRGGGAYGKEWHDAGRKLTKPNTWKDFIACAEYLVKERYTSPANLAGRGRSAGGILIGRAVTERPDLFAAASIEVGCVDMLRFETTMNGAPNVPEFGTVTKKDEFRGLLSMSTLHQIKDGVKYPALLISQGINDPRNEPWMSAKITARFQAASSSGKPVLLRVDYHGGHGFGFGSTRSQLREELADAWSFYIWQMGER